MEGSPLTTEATNWRLSLAPTLPSDPAFTFLLPNGDAILRINFDRTVWVATDIRAAAEAFWAAVDELGAGLSESK